MPRASIVSGIRYPKKAIWKDAVMQPEKMKIDLVINSGAGLVNSRFPSLNIEQLQDIVTSMNPANQVHVAKPDEMEETIRASVENGAEVVAVAGGDGTMSLAANILAGTPAALAVIPAGTFNLVAKDLSTPSNIEKALLSVFSGTPQEMDLGEVNGRIFLHHVSIGLHPRGIELRERLFQKVGMGKIVLSLFSMGISVLNPPRLRLTLMTGNNERHIAGPFLFIGNNRYGTEPFRFIRRKTFIDGRLNVFYTQRVTTSGILRLVLHSFLEKKMHRVIDLERFYTEQLTIHGKGKHLKASVDGELCKLNYPVHIRVLRRKLRIISGMGE